MKEYSEKERCKVFENLIGRVGRDLGSFLFQKWKKKLWNF
jgi:hypothetical protein